LAQNVKRWSKPRAALLFQASKIPKRVERVGNGFRDFCEWESWRDRKYIEKTFISSILKRIMKMLTLYTGSNMKDRKGPAHAE
jgi:hypothetical protein